MLLLLLLLQIELSQKVKQNERVTTEAQKVIKQATHNSN